MKIKKILSNTSLFKKVRSQKGFTLLEVLISVVILSIIITPILAMFTSAFKTTVISQNLLDGAYIAQDAFEDLVNSDYSSLMSTPSSKRLYDSDGDGTDDCYIETVVYPDGVYPDLTPVQNPSYMHINVVDEQVYIMGSSGTDDSSGVGTLMTSLGDITVSNSSISSTVSVSAAGGGATMTFNKKYETCPLVIIVNIYKKKVNTQTFALTLAGDTSSLYVVEYARKHNFEEFTCTQLSNNSIYYGVNDYSTTLLHAVVEVYDIKDSENRIGFVEGTFEVSLS